MSVPATVVLLLAVPVLRDAFDFGPLDPIGWVMATGAGTLSVTWFEISKHRIPW